MQTNCVPTVALYAMESVKDRLHRFRETTSNTMSSAVDLVVAYLQHYFSQKVAFPITFYPLY
jgi:hypothetical protein